MFIGQEEQAKTVATLAINDLRLRIMRLTRSSYFFSETYCGGYSGEDPPLPIPNREVKLTIADGTAPPGGRVGSCHFLLEALETYVLRAFLFVPFPLLVNLLLGQT